MQKIVNVLAVASSVVSLAVVGSGLYVYVNRASIIDGIKSQAVEAVTGSLGGLGGAGLGGSLGGAGLGGDLPIGAPDLAAPDTSATAPQGASMGLPVPSSAFQ